jgi:hypothetical protein
MRVSPINNQPIINKAQISKEVCSNNVNFASRLTLKPQGKINDNVFLNKIVTSLKDLKTHFETLLKAFIIATILNTPCSVNGVMSEKKFFNTKEEAIEYSINKITAHLNSPNPKEYVVILDYNDYSVMFENVGNENSVQSYSKEMLENKSKGIEKPFIALHGHPLDLKNQNNTPATQTFSYQDFKVFNNDNNCKEDYVVNNRGQYCILRKSENSSPLTKQELEELEEKFNHEFRTCWPNSVALIGDNGDVILRFNDYQGMHRFWNNVAKEHGLEYYTTYGIYEGKDAYIDKYYPETKDDVGDMSSHRTFKQ